MRPIAYSIGAERGVAGKGKTPSAIHHCFFSLVSLRPTTCVVSRPGLGSSAIMASLLPLLHDLLPMIMPSEAHMVRGDAPPSVEERAETPPWWYQQQSSGAERGPAPGASSPAPRPRTGDDDGQVSISSSESDAGLLLEPIQLLDREERLAAAIVPVWTRQGHSSGPTPKPPQQTVTAGPKVFRRDVMVGVTDKMCATGKPKSTSFAPLWLFPSGPLLYLVGSACPDSSNPHPKHTHTHAHLSFPRNAIPSEV